MGKRYREFDVPLEQLAANSSDHMSILTAVLGIGIGVVLVILGRLGKQM